MQTDYNDLSAAVKGALADIGYSDKVGRFAAAGIGFGLGLAATSIPGQAEVPTATGFVFEGISVQTNKMTLNATGEAIYQAGEEITVLRRGRIWVQTEVATAVDDPVFLRHTANATLVPGDFRINADTARADQLTGARWLTETTAAGLILLEITLP